MLYLGGFAGARSAITGLHGIDVGIAEREVGGFELAARSSIYDLWAAWKL
jgi:hypothetical protein